MAAANNLGLEIMPETKKEEDFAAPNFPMNNRLAGHQRNETMDNAAQKTKIKKPEINNVNYDRLVMPSQTEARESEVSSIATAQPVDEEADKYDGTE